ARRAFRGRRKGRCAGDPVRQESPQGAGLDQGARSRRRKGGDRAVRLLGFGGDLGRYSWHRAQAAHRQVSLSAPAVLGSNKWAPVATGAFLLPRRTRSGSCFLYIASQLM